MQVRLESDFESNQELLKHSRVSNACNWSFKKMTHLEALLSHAGIQKIKFHPLKTEFLLHGQIRCPGS